MTQPKLDISGLSKSYGSAVALQPTDLAIAPGEFLTLLGPSGSGKTTLLMMIAGLTEPTGGTIRLDGADITALPAHRRNIGVVFQNYALFPHLTVRENVAFPLRMRRRSEAEIGAAVGRALDLVRLGHLAERLPRELSGGQQQRVAFARAIVFEPRLVLMDEPLGALDKKLRDELKLEIRKLHRDLKTTVVYVTHDQEEAMLLSDRVCLMNDARVEQIDPPARLYALPASRFAASFVGESNILSCIAAEGAVVADGLRLPTSHGARLPASGTPVDVLVRPERIRLATAQDALALDCLVQDVIDLGGTRRITVRVAPGLTLTLAMLGGGQPVTPHQRLSLAIDPADVIPLPAGLGVAA